MHSAWCAPDHPLFKYAFVSLVLHVFLEVNSNFLMCIKRNWYSNPGLSLGDIMIYVVVFFSFYFFEKCLGCAGEAELYAYWKA